MEFHHVSVMAAECMQALQPERGGIYVDCTAGGGGHSLEIAKRLPEGSRIISLDRDDNAIAACTARLAPYADKHPIVNAGLDYRTLTKLKSTYADGLTAVIASDGRIHTSFQMTVTATGRLSSTEPNLQNIPVRKNI